MCKIYQVLPSSFLLITSSATSQVLLSVHVEAATQGMSCCPAGINYGTMLHRLDAIVLKWLPKKVKEPLKKTVSSVVSVGQKGLQATAGRVTDTLVGRSVIMFLLMSHSHFLQWRIKL